MSRRGHTLIELMVALVLIACVGGIAATLVADARDEDRVTQGYADDLRHVRRASDLLSAAVRSSTHVEYDGEILTTDGTRWSVDDGVLRRDGERAVAGISRLHAAPATDRTWDVGVAPVPRRSGAAAPALTTRVRQRPEAAR